MSRNHAQLTIEYRLDAHDCITHVSQEWDPFARRNGARELTAESVVGAPLSRFFTGDDTRSLYDNLFSRVRRDGVSVRVAFRCDSPTLRRHMELEVFPEADDRLRIESRLLRVETTPYRALLDSSVERSNVWVRLCGWCKRVESADGSWVEPEVAMTSMNSTHESATPAVTHGMCEACHRDFVAAIDQNPA